VLLIPVLLLIAVAMLIGISIEQADITTQIIKDVSAGEAFNLIQENQNNPDFTTIDVRTPDEFADGHVEGAVNIDFQSDDFRREISMLDRDKTYLIYCRSGSRSRGALEIMIELGFMKAYHQSTGIIGWLNEGLPTVKYNHKEVRSELETF